MKTTVCFFFFFNDTATTEIYTLSLHDALPISRAPRSGCRRCCFHRQALRERREPHGEQSRNPSSRRHGLHLGKRPSPVLPARESLDRKSTRLNSSHGYISYAVFCLKKKHNLN